MGEFYEPTWLCDTATSESCMQHVLFEGDLNFFVHLLGRSWTDREQWQR
ncbi:hypothetical protein [Acinetobacter puyangensis]